MIDSDDTFRSLCLSALIVLSVLAGTTALTGTTAAQTLAQSDADAYLDSGSTFWQGQELLLNAAGSQGADDTLQIRTVTDDGNVGDLVTELTVDGADQNTTIDTSDLDGQYVVVNDTHILEFGSQGTVTNTYPMGGDNEESNVAAASWEVAVQTLSAEFDQDDVPVNTGETATLEIDSNRATFPVNVSASGLDEEDLAEIFGQAGDNNFVAASGTDGDDDDSIQLDPTTNEIEANFSEFDEPGSYTFDLEVTDTGASASASVEVQEEDVTLGLQRSVVSEERGDIAEITVNMADATEAWVYVGGADVNYLERVHVVDEDEDGQVTIDFNSFQAGWNESAAAGDAYDRNTEDETGFSVAGDDAIGADGVTRYDTSAINANSDPGNTLDESIASDLNEPLETGEYIVVVSSSSEGPFANDDGELTIPDEEDLGTLELTERSTDEINTWRAPAGDIDLDVDDDELEEELASATQTDRIAEGDRLIVQVQASGIYGYLDGDDETTVSDLLSETGEGTAAGLRLWVESAAGGANQPDQALNLTTENSALYADEGNNTFYLVVDTAQIDDVETGEPYEANFRVGENDDDTPAENPYLDSDEQQLVTTELTVESAEASFEDVQDGTLQVPQAGQATISGTTNVAPGTELTVQLRRGGDPPFLRENSDIVVQPDGTFRTTFDVSDLPVDTTFTATVLRDGTQLTDGRTDAVIVEQATPTPAATPTPGEETPTPGATPTPTETPTEEETPAEDETPQPEETPTDGQPGFGVVIAIVALLGAALLALRRRD